MAKGKQARQRALEVAATQRLLSREELLTPRIIEREEVVETLGGTIRIRSLSYEQRSEIRKATKWGTPEVNEELFELMCIAESIVEPSLTLDDLKALQAQDIGIVDELSLKVQLINLPGEARELKKGFDPTQNSDSGSSSPNGST